MSDPFQVHLNVGGVVGAILGLVSPFLGAWFVTGRAPLEEPDLTTHLLAYAAMLLALGGAAVGNRVEDAWRGKRKADSEPAGAADNRPRD